MKQSYPDRPTEGEIMAFLNKVIFDELFVTNSEQVWRKHIPVIVNICHRLSAITVLGVVLTRDGITPLVSPMVSVPAAKLWVKLWKERIGDDKNFSIAESLLNAAVACKESGGDRRSILILPRELRSLIEPLLVGIPPKN